MTSMGVLNPNDRGPVGVFHDRPTLILAVLALLPIVSISILGRYYSSLLEGIAPVDLTNFRATSNMLRGVFRMSDAGDSWLPMREALNVLRSDQADHLYEILFFTKTIRFQYPPTSLLPLQSLAAIGFSTRGALSTINFSFYCLNAIAVAVVAWQLFGQAYQTAPSEPSSSRPHLDAAGVAALAFILAFMFYPLVRAQVLGQIQVWIDTLFTFAVICWLRGSRFCSGVFIGLACTIKPQMALLLVWGLLWQETLFCAGIVTCAVPLGAISLAYYGLHNHLAYLDVLAFLSRHGESFFANNSVNGILNGYFSSNDPHVWDATSLTSYNPIVYAGTLLAALVAILLLVLPPLLWRRGTKANIEMFGAASICTVVGSPVAWEHHYGILLPIFFIALRAALAIPTGSARTLILATILLSWILVADFIPFTLLLAQTPFRFAEAHCFLGALLLLFALLRTQQPENFRA
jgi:hypothetical protein